MDALYDCIVVGAGPAGLSASLFLARYLHRVLTFHPNSPRNEYAHGVHGFLGHHGISPGELLSGPQMVQKLKCYHRAGDQLILPLHDNHEQAFPTAHFNKVREDLMNRFGGVTAFLRSPAIGLWKANSADVNRDEVVMFEVLTEQVDKDWWADYRKQLQDKFRQDELLVWASDITQI
jgi:glycine/D-amino acid oxidase-like deaminating enzyme